MTSRQPVMQRLADDGFHDDEELGVPRQKYLAHAARAELADNLVPIRKASSRRHY